MMNEVGSAEVGAEKAAHTILEFGASHGIGRSLVYEEIAAGRLKCRKVGRRTLILAKDAEAWRDALPDIVVRLLASAVAKAV
ncbi:helix-turn-helix domain-containing protein [Mesorhizobium sp. WSM3224]|uniref:helix-turn-helix domain-containing protein n=1 Tax=Mesorhizobium sp. WSM3224 TaxID=1040986 RepID=UPI001FDA46C2|nr:helix-turn-helix domain-containing protein [Mesorhizobium sp. WSM3224]